MGLRTPVGSPWNGFGDTSGILHALGILLTTGFEMGRIFYGTPWEGADRNMLDGDQMGVDGCHP